MLILLSLLCADLRNYEITLSSAEGLPVSLVGWAEDPRPYLRDYVNGKTFDLNTYDLSKGTKKTCFYKDGNLLFQQNFSGPKLINSIGIDKDGNRRVLNKPQIWGAYEDENLVIYGVDFGGTPKVYLVGNTVEELPILNAPGDKQKNQWTFEYNYVVRVKPVQGKIVVSSGELGPFGLSNVLEFSRAAVSLTEIEGGEIKGDLTMPNNTSLANSRIYGRVLMGENCELRNCTIIEDLDYLVSIKNGCKVIGCTLINRRDNGACIKPYILGVKDVLIKDNTMQGCYGVQYVIGKPVRNERVVQIRNRFKGVSRYGTNRAGFILGLQCVVAGNVVEDSYRGIVAQAWAGPVLHNLVYMNDFRNGGFNIAGGEQILFETELGYFGRAEVGTSKGNMVELNPIYDYSSCKGLTCMGETDYGIIVEAFGGYVKLDRPIKSGPVKIGCIATENLILLNRIENCRIGTMFWMNSCGNITSALQAYNTPWAYNQNGTGSVNTSHVNNIVRDCMFTNSGLTVTNKDGQGKYHHNLRIVRCEFWQSHLRLDGRGPNVGEVLLSKCIFGLNDPRLNIDFNADWPTQKLPYPPIWNTNFKLYLHDCRLNGIKTDLVTNYTG